MKHARIRDLLITGCTAGGCGCSPLGLPPLCGGGLLLHHQSCNARRRPPRGVWPSRTSVAVGRGGGLSRGWCGAEAAGERRRAGAGRRVLAVVALRQRRRSRGLRAFAPLFESVAAAGGVRRVALARARAVGRLAAGGWWCGGHAVRVQRRARAAQGRRVGGGAARAAAAAARRVACGQPVEAGARAQPGGQQRRGLLRGGGRAARRRRGAVRRRDGAKGTGKRGALPATQLAPGDAPRDAPPACR